MKFRYFTIVITAVLPLLLLDGCVKKLAMNAVAKALTTEGPSPFTTDDDPELVGDALPFALKMYESILVQTPDNDRMYYSTGKSYVSYAYAFVNTPADTISDARMEFRDHQYKRAKKLYLRGRNYLLKAMELRHPGFNACLDRDKTDSALALTTIADSALLYWTGMAWMGAFTVDKFDMSLLADIGKPIAILNRAYKLDPDFGAGALDEYFISFYGGMPKSMGGDKKKAHSCFDRAVKLSGGSRLGPYISLASAVCIPEQNRTEFENLLDSALAIDVDKYPDNRLVNTISRQKAQWMLDNIDNYFVGEKSDSTAVQDSGETKK